jgi:flagellar hook-length control protein FliK
MVGNLNLLGGLGASVAEPAASTESAAPVAGGAFAALIDRAAAEPGLATPPALKDPTQGIVWRGVVADWSLFGPAQPASPELVDGGDVDDPDDAELQTEPIAEPDVADELHVIVPTLVSLEAFRVRLQQYPSPTGDAAAAANAATTPEIAAAVPAASAAVDSASGAQPDGMSKLERRGHAPGPVDRAPLQGRPAESVSTEQALLALDLASAEAIRETVERPTPSESSVPLESAGELPTASKSIASQFSKAMERLGQTFGEQTTASAPDVRAELSSGGQTPNFSSPSQDPERAAASGSASAQAPAASFMSHFASELHRLPTAPVQVTQSAAAPHLSAPDVDTAQQLVRAMQLQFRDGIGDAVVRLNPEHLGEVSIALRVEQQSVTATVSAEVASVRQWLESQEGQLRQGLSEHGLTLEKLVVKEDESKGREENSREDDAPRQQNRRDRRGRSEDEPKFEVIV